MYKIANLKEFNSLLEFLPEPDQETEVMARQRQEQLTKPPGSLGYLEDLAIWLSSWQGRERPKLDNVQALIFAGNHGVTAQGVSAFPAEVTAQMVANFKSGGAAINQLCKQSGAKLEVIALDLETPTKDFTVEPAMDETTFVKSINAGMVAVDQKADCLIVGEMGIGNTTSAAAVCMCLFGGPPEDWVGRGTGVDEDGLKRKAEAIDKARSLHAEAFVTPFDVLRCVGGRELAAIMGAVVAARLANVPVILDGYITTAAVGALEAALPGALAHCIAGHRSSEPGHDRVLQHINKTPILDLNMRLGEGSGAATALLILRAAIATHNGMATFAEAGVSGSD